MTGRTMHSNYAWHVRLCAFPLKVFLVSSIRIHLIARMRDNGVKRKDKLFCSFKCVMRFLYGMRQVCVVLAENR